MSRQIVFNVPDIPLGTESVVTKSVEPPSLLNNTALGSGFDWNAAEYVEVAHRNHFLVCTETYLSPNQRRSIINGSFQLEPGGDEETCIYTDYVQKRSIIGFRGSSVAKDFLVDDLILSIRDGSLPGSEPGFKSNACNFPRFQQALTIFKAFRESHPGFRIDCTGHSLGGAIARCVGNSIGTIVVTFNPAAPPTNPVTVANNEFDYHIVFDIISAWTSPRTVRIDKGFRPLEKGLGSKLLNFTGAITNILGSVSLDLRRLSPIAEAHGLINFTNKWNGKIISAAEENELWQTWYNGLSNSLKTLLTPVLGGNRVPPIL